MTAFLNFNKVVHELNSTFFNTSAANYFEPLLEKYFPNQSLVQIKGIVKEITQEFTDKITLTIQPNKKWKLFKAGQYVEIGVKINGVIYKRPFTISSSVDQFKKNNTFSVTIQKINNGKVTNHINNHLKKGASVLLSQAHGDFINKTEDAPLLYIAGGTGITPFRSMLYECIQQNKNVTLLYYAKSGQHLFKEELLKLNSSVNIKVQLIETDKEGRISISHLQNYCEDFSARQFFICGPNAMIETTKTLLEENKIAIENITVELFTLQMIDNDSLQYNRGTVAVKNATVETQGTTTILEALEANGFQPVYGCRMGVCKQCQCKKNTGVIFNQLTGTYSENGEGYIQPCVSIPIGEITIELKQ